MSLKGRQTQPRDIVGNILLAVMLISLCACIYLVHAPELLLNNGFEGGYQSLVVNASASDQDMGAIASGWTDNSAWADLKARYSADYDNPHSGRTCQRVDVLNVNRGSLQFGQTCVLDEGYYQATLWLRSKTSTQVQVVLQQGNAPYNNFCARNFTVSPIWTKATISGYIPQHGSVCLMIVTDSPATLWIDDASLHAGSPLDFRFLRWQCLSLIQRLTQGLTGGVEQPAAHAGETDKWLLTFDDEFHERGLDPAKWSASEGSPDAPENPVQYFLPREVSLVGGCLHLNTERNAYRRYPFRSGEISTLNKFAQQYGRFETRCRFPKTKGAWSAFYLLPASNAWPPEIDIAETIGRDPHSVYLTSHWQDADSNHQKESALFSSATWNTSDWHTYAVEWSPKSIFWYVDGVRQAATSTGVPQEPMYVRLNTAVGGGFAGKPQLAGWPQSFDVEYVRVYRQAGEPGPILGSLAQEPRQLLLTYWPGWLLLLGPLFTGKKLVRMRGSDFGTALLALAVTGSALNYSVFRLQIINWDDWYFALPLLFAELFGVVHVLGLQYTLWPRVPVPLHTLENRSAGPIFVFIPTVNEGVSVLEPTILGALVARSAYLEAYPGTTVEIVVCNDGQAAAAAGWQEVEVLAERLGVRCITRSEGGGAKAGNIEFCRQLVGGTGEALLVIFDADQIAHRDFLLRTVPLFSEARIGWVQTGQYYRNLDNPVARWANDQQSLFYQVLCPAKAAQNSAFMCGTNLVIRAACLDEIGGFPQDSVTEDFKASLLLHPRWRSLFLTEVLATGLGPVDLRSYFSQQNRWASGTLGVLRSHWRDIFLPGPRRLSFAQRVQYGLASTHYLCGLRDLIFLAAPLAYIFYGFSAIQGVTLPTFLAHFLPYLFLSQVAFWRVFRRKTGVRGILIGFGSFPVLLQSFLRVLGGQKIGFAVTDKRRARMPSWLALLPHVVCAGACLVGIGSAIRAGVTSEILAMSALWIAYSLAMLCGVLWLGSLDLLAWRRAKINTEIINLDSAFDSPVEIAFRISSVATSQDSVEGDAIT